MKTITLTNGMTTKVACEDYESLKQYCWGAIKTHSTYYAVRYSRVNGKLIRIFMHRQIMQVTDRGVWVDHIDRNGLNNTIENLRLSSASQNSANRKSKRNSSSKYLGVSFSKPLNKWRADIRKNGKQHFIGYFFTEEDAALAYNKKANELHGEFANCNQLDNYL